MVRPLSYATALSILTAGSLAAQGPAESGAFIVRLGTDTIAVERFTRTANRLEGEQVMRSPRTVIRRYTMTLAPDESVSRLESSTRAPGAASGAAPMRETTVTIEGDTVTVAMRQGDSTQTMKVRAPDGVIPILFPSYGPVELATRRARRAGRDSVDVPVYFVGFEEAGPMSIKRLGADSMTVTTLFGTSHARVDRDGRLISLDAPGTTFQATVERVTSVDIAAMATAFAAREKTGRALGELSPRDTVEASVGGATLAVEYSRPSRRGRTIFGKVVPWGKVWRTGANEATHFRTDHDLIIGGVTVPAGTYTLFTLPSPSGWKLIVNKQTGQSGTEYTEAEDLARIDMKVESLPKPVEQFTLDVEPHAKGGMLRLRWDTTQASVPFTVK